MTYISNIYIQTGLLAIEENKTVFILVSAGIVFCYLIIQPFIKWFVTLQSVRLLSYIICSLFVLILCFLIMFFIGDLRKLAAGFLKVTLQGIAFFGIVLFIIYSILHLINKQTKT